MLRLRSLLGQWQSQHKGHQRYSGKARKYRQPQDRMTQRLQMTGRVVLHQT